MGSDFKVIVIGGGPIGLIVAHALHHADIDFVVLERRPAIVEEIGASLVVYPTTFRVMHQLGILESLLPRGGELETHVSLTKDGHVFNESPRYRTVRENHGHGPVAFDRSEVVETVYNLLPDIAKEKVLTNKQLSNIETKGDGVEVTCVDGSFYHGSIVIGADGVHSKTRHLMRDIALKEDPLRDWDPEEPFTAKFRLLFGAFPTPSPSGEGNDTQSSGKSVSYFSGPKRSWFFMSEKLPKPTSERKQYTEKDVNALGAEFADFPLNRTVKVKDIWPSISAVGMTDLQEGIAKHWSLGRIVLVGDSCHKFTVHMGLGFNNGVQDVVVLCNRLRGAVQSASDRNPNAAALTHVFDDYERVRKSSDCSLVGDLSNSGMETRMYTWYNTFYRLLSRYVIIHSFVERLALRFSFSPGLQKAQVLDYIEASEPMNGKLPWLHPMKTKRL
ncbi:Monooxygenase FAD-binding [Penicillium robsamsonii]|uniref:Monooxygenase FAD-binding n=1 Tax=Penicillium robsamsonii TaxID=1792511 RepID=UPI002547A4A3|nr:Monooxygenase FAD-binding [Penicillium robsamsonii]KAJ5807587.1 Monooxygenase FAD-binding [Penicillium robsamsonii]